MTAAHAPAKLDAYGWLLGLLDVVGSGPAGKPVRQCPAHGDAAPSLSLTRGDDGRVLMRCHAGCTAQQVMASLNLPMARLFKPATMTPEKYARTFLRDMTFPPLDHRGSGHPATRGSRKRTSGRGWRFEGEHAYGDRYWLLRYRHATTGAKELSWECLNPRGERVPGLLGTPTTELPLYMESQIRLAVTVGEPVLLVESESSVDALVRAGWYATTWAGGASAVKVGALLEVLAEYPHMVVIPDNDEPGLAALEALRSAALAPHVLMPAEGEDARDLLERVGLQEFRALIAEALGR